MRSILTTLFLSSIFLMACDSSSEGNTEVKHTGHQEKPVTGFTLVPSSQSGISFVNQIEETEDNNALIWDAIFSGSGVAIGDLNNDGLPDLVFGGNQVGDKIYINQGGFKFEDATAGSGLEAHPGWTTGVNLVDINNDGLQDIYFSRSSYKLDNASITDREDKFFLNQGDLTFKESIDSLGLANPSYTTQVSFFDLENDGDLDVFMLNAPSNNIKQKVAYNDSGIPDFAADRILRNDEGKFTDISRACGVANLSFGLGVVTADINHDGWTDIYVANDYERPDYLYINQKDGTFKNELNDRIKHTSFTAMGVDVADINGDALQDIGVLDMQSESHYRSKTNMPSMDAERFFSYVDKGYNYQYMTNTLQVNHGYGMFSDVAQFAGMPSTDWSWSILMADFDNDSHRDIYITNGINKDIRNNDFATEFATLQKEESTINLLDLSQKIPSTKLPNYMLSGKGTLEFEKVTGAWGLELPSFSFGAAYADLDQDGDLDLVVCNNEEAPFLFRNDSQGNHLRIAFKGPKSNPTGIGTKAVVFHKGQKQYQELITARGYQSACEPILHFGLGEHQKADSILVLLPSGKSIKLKETAANQVLNIDLSKAIEQSYDVYGLGKTYFVDISAKSAPEFLHRENEYNDWDKEILLPHKQSQAGSRSVVGDLNGDGLDDIWIGGAAGQSGAIFLQTAQAQFTKTPQPALLASKASEDMDAALLDVDQDGDLDLYVTQGGGQWPEGDPKNEDHLYLNNGKGIFALAKESTLPPNNGGATIAADFNSDGAMDIVTASRGLPGQYPANGLSITLLNENGRLVATDASTCELLNVGMVSDLLYEDFYPDMPGKELLAIGEWMAPAFFQWSETGWKRIGDEQKELSGWWFSATALDANGDGRMDVALGNIGLNSKYHPTEENPMKVYAGDLDDNGTNDVVLAKTFKGKYVPVRGRECSSEQLPFVKDEFEEFDAFAKASIEDILAEKMDKALYKEVSQFASGILYNEPQGWRFEPFPPMAQISAVRGMTIKDFNKDGNPDILLAGNLFEAEVETTRHDASNGLLLLSNAQDGFEPVDLLYSGFYAPGNVRDLKEIKNANGKAMYLVVNNNSKPQLFLENR